MGLSGLIVGALVVGLGLYLLLGVAVIVTSLLETRPLNQLVPATKDDPEWTKLPSQSPRGLGFVEAQFNPYEAPASPITTESANATAARLGFYFQGLFGHVKGGTYKTHNTLWMSPDQETLAVIGWGTIASLKADRQILYTELDDGRYLVTSAKSTGAETPGFYENLIVLNADLERLVERHQERIRTCGRLVRPFRSQEAMFEYHAILERRAQFLVENGDAYFADPARTAIRSTFSGAIKAYLRTLRPMKYVDRETNSAVAFENRPTPAAIVWLTRLCYMMLIGGFVLNTQGKAHSAAQALFRLSLFGGSMVGFFVVFIAKMILRGQKQNV